MISSILSMYRPNFAKTIVYMLQATEYNVPTYFKWLGRVHDFRKVMYRRDLHKTRVAKLLLSFVRGGMLIQELAAVIWFVHLILNPTAWQFFAAAILFVSAPLVWSVLSVLPLVAGRWFIIEPLTWWQVWQSKRIFSKHKAIKIAVAGSYGKTTMKEILKEVLAGSKKVAATPANKNVARAHAQFAKGLSGDEEIMIIEFGEGAPGDVWQFTRVVKPYIAVITGLAPAHLDKYKSLQAAGDDIFYLGRYLKAKDVYVNQDSQAVKPFLKATYQLYGHDGAAGWRVSDIKSDLKGLSFKLKRGNDELVLSSQLVGQHQVGPLALAAILAKRLGLDDEAIKAGIARVESFEHRMQPKEIHDGWLIDDTYNGNIDGMKVGLDLLKDLKAKRKIYVTPGLVDQGAETDKIHQQLGEMIAAATPDIVVLMKHSVTDDIQIGLKSKKFTGKVIVEDDPLNFYNNLDQFMAAGDLVLMQNDWPDNYV